MVKELSLLLTLVLIAVALALIWLGWRNRLRRQSDVEPLPEMPAALGAALAVADGQYVATTTAGDWLDRIAVHNLGIRTNAELSVHPEGVLFDRSGAGPVFIPAASLTGVRQESGMAGKFVEKDGLLVLSWMLGSRELDSGFRTRHAGDKATLLNALQDLIPAAPQANADSGK
ncbi:PH-like domain-containing protein [Pseudarthrobacter sp. 1C304]|uniref:PH-like domain-containing protein n=1 Tax=Pseudarthrobacter sp. 1C304 TaxID=3457438 RepID=UPI003FD56034